MKYFWQNTKKTVIENAADKPNTNGLTVDNSAMPKLKALFETQQITPASIQSAISSVRTGKKYKSLLNIMNLFMDSDDHLQHCIDVRTEALKKVTYSYVTELNDAQKEYFDTLLKQYLPKMVDEFITGKLFGVQFCQILYGFDEVTKLYTLNGLVNYWEQGLDIRKVNNQMVLYSDEKPFEIDERKILFYQIGKPKLQALLKYYVFYNFAINNWAQFTEIYGKPFRLGKFGVGATQKDINTLTSAVKSLSTDQGAVIPDSVMIEFIDFVGKTASKDLYHALLEFTQERITRRLLGQTLTTIAPATGTQALGKESNKVTSDITDADVRELTNFVNMILKRFGNFNYGMDVVVQMEINEPVNQSEKKDIITSMVNLGLRIGVKHIYDTFNIPEPEADEEVLSGRQQPAIEQPNSNKMPIPRIYRNDNTYQANAVNYVQLDKLQNELRNLPTIEQLNSWKPEWFVTWLGDLLASGAVIAYHTAKNKYKSRYTNSGIPNLEVAWNDQSIETANRMRNQAFIISGVRVQEQLEVVRQTAINVLESGGSFTDFIQKAELAGFSPNNPYHLRTEYDTAIASAQSAGIWDEIQEVKDYYPYLRYMTMQDELVRDEHAALDGMIAAVDDPIWDSYMPPNGWNCRCSVESISESEAEDDPKFRAAKPEQKLEPGFSRNPGKTGLLNEVNKDYANAMPYIAGELTASGVMPKPVNVEIDVNELQDKIAKYLSNKIVYDKSNYPVKLSSEAAVKIAVNEQAANYNAIEYVITQPDEVWQQNGKTIYVKMFEGNKLHTVVVKNGKLYDLGGVRTGIRE